MAKEVKIVLTNRLTYTLIFTGVLLSMAWFVMAVAGVSHDASELEGVCRSDGTNCAAITETDPTVPANIKDGITWTEISNRPAGLDDGDQTGTTLNQNGCTWHDEPVHTQWGPGVVCPGGKYVAGARMFVGPINVDDERVSVYCCSP